MRSRLCLAALAALACSKQAPPGAGAGSGVAAGVHVDAPVASAPASPVTDQIPQTEVTWTYAETPVGAMNAVVVLPARKPDERFPVLLTFHGMGEARKGPEKGARGWIDDYGMLKAIERLHH